MFKHADISGEIREAFPFKPQKPAIGYAKKFSRAAVVILFSITLTGGIFTQVAYAAATDDDLQQVTQIFTRGGSVCTTNYAIDIDTYMQTQSLWTNTTNYTAYASAYNTAKTSGGVVVSQQFISTGEKRVQVYFSTGSGSSMSWGVGGVTYNRLGSPQQPSDLYHVTIASNFAVNGNGTCDGRVTGSARVASATISTDPATAAQGSDIKNYYATTGVNYNYPQGYTGFLFRANQIIQNTFAPAIRYTVDVTNIQAAYNSNIAHAGAANMLWTISQKVNNGIVQKDTKLIDKNATYTYTVQEYGQYQMTATYIPTGSDLNPGFTIIQTVVDFIVDGTSYSQQSTDLNCTNGICTQKSVYEDCGTYGTNVVGGFGCVMRNFGTFLKSILIGIFIPQTTKITDLLTQTVSLAQQRLGFLVYPIQWLTDLLSKFSDTTNNWCNNTTCNVNAGNLFGAPFNLDLLSARTRVPQLYNFGLVILRGMVVAGLIFMLRTKYLEITKK